MVRSVLVLRARDGRRDDVVKLFAELGILEQSSAVLGFIGAELQVATDGSDELLVTATWDSEAAYDAWLASPVREQLRPALEELLAESPGPRVFEVVRAIP